jgi:uncharacterized protein (TIGR02996 family)
MTGPRARTGEEVVKKPATAGFFRGVVMATHLTTDDLVRFLRDRQAPSCRVMADWVAGHPNSDVSKGAVDRLERYVLGVANSVEMRHVALAANRSGTGNPVYNIPHLDNAIRSSCLCLVASRYSDESLRRLSVWPDLMTAARFHVESRIPAWAAALTRQFNQLMRATPELRGQPLTSEPDQLVRFRQAVAERPDDDALRQAYADWLEEHGDTDESLAQRVIAMWGGDPAIDIWTRDRVFRNTGPRVRGVGRLFTHCGDSVRVIYWRAESPFDFNDVLVHYWEECDCPVAWYVPTRARPAKTWHRGIWKVSNPNTPDIPTTCGQECIEDRVARTET